MNKGLIIKRANEQRVMLFWRGKCIGILEVEAPMNVGLIFKFDSDVEIRREETLTAEEKNAVDRLWENLYDGEEETTA